MIQLKKIDKVINNGQTRTFKVLRRRPLHPIIANKFVSHTPEASVIGRNIRYINKLCEVQIDVDSTDCNKLGFIYTRKIQPLTASTDRGRTGRTDACTLQKARGRESRGDFNFRGVEVEEGETPPAAVGRTAEGETERERRELSKGEKSRHVLLTSQEQKDTEREGERDRGQTEDPFCGAIGASKIKYLLARPPRLPHSLGVVSCVASFSLTTHDRGRRRHRGSLIPGFLFLRPFAASFARVFRVRYWFSDRGTIELVEREIHKTSLARASVLALFPFPLPPIWSELMVGGRIIIVLGT